MTSAAQRRVCACALGVASSALVGCGTDVRPAVTVSDSAGVRITLSADAPRVFADVDPSPALSIGGAEDAGPSRFYRIQNLRVDGRGRVWVADGGSGELRIFLPDGTPWKTRGGVGEGPGEFTSIRLLGAFAGDSVLVADDANGRVTVFDPEGEIARSVSESGADGPWPRLFAAFPDGSALGQVPRILGADALRPDQLLVDSVKLVRVDLPGGARAPVGEAEGPLWIWTGTDQVPMPFTVNAGFDVIDGSVHLVAGPAFRVRVFERGRIVAVYGVDRAPRSVGDEDVAAYRAFIEDYVPEPRRAGFLSALRNDALPSALPAYRSVTPASDGHVWVERYEADPAAPPAWDVYDHEGRFAGGVRGPPGLVLSTVTADALVGVWRDGMGVERVRSYPFVPRPAEAPALPDASGLRSWLMGTSALTLLLMVAAGLTASRPLVPLADRSRRRLVVIGIAAIGFQATHFVEEYMTGFYDAFPRVLGLPPWGSGAFVAFNVAWLGIWALSLAGVRRGWRPAEWPIWFLACALVANGVAHPLLSLARGRYFPGLATAPVVGVSGLLLLREMLLGSHRLARSAAGAR